MWTLRQSFTLNPAWSLCHVVLSCWYIKLYALVQLLPDHVKPLDASGRNHNKISMMILSRRWKKGLSLTRPGTILHRRLYLLVCVRVMCECVSAYVCGGRGCVICEWVCVLIGGLLSWGIIHLSPSGPLAADTFLILHTHTLAHTC